MRIHHSTRGFHSSTSHLNRSRFLTETTAKSAHIRPKSGRLITAVFGQYRGFHSSTSQLNLSRSSHRIQPIPTRIPLRVLTIRREMGRVCDPDPQP